MKLVSDAKKNTSNAVRGAISDSLTTVRLIKLRSKMGGEDFHPEYDCDLTMLHADIDKAIKIMKEIESWFPTYSDR